MTRTLNRTLSTALIALAPLTLLCAGQAGVSPKSGIPADIEIFDRTVPLDGTTLHAIVTRPRAPGVYPAVFVISGLGCYPIDRPEEDSTFNQLRFGLTRR